MFCTHIFLVKDSPLRAAWIAAHLERRLQRNQITEVSIVSAVDMILLCEAPIALRLSAHLLLGLVKIFSMKVKYHLQDCQITVLRFKQTVSDEALKLPNDSWHSGCTTLISCEGIDFDELQYIPDQESSGCRAECEEHHIKPRDQITLQESIEENMCSSLQFDLDERFLDGGTQHAFFFDDFLVTSQPCGMEILCSTFPEEFLLPEKSLENLQLLTSYLSASGSFEEDRHSDNERATEMYLDADTTSSSRLKHIDDGDPSKYPGLQVAPPSQVQLVACNAKYFRPQLAGLPKCNETTLEQNGFSPACSLGEVYELEHVEDLKQHQVPPTKKLSYANSKEDACGEVINPVLDGALTIELFEEEHRCDLDSKCISSLIKSKSPPAGLLLMGFEDHENISSVTVGTPAYEATPSLTHSPTSDISNSPLKSLYVKRKLLFDNSSASQPDCRLLQEKQFLSPCNDQRGWKVRKKLRTRWPESWMPEKLISPEEAFSKPSIHGLCQELESSYSKILNCNSGLVWGNSSCLFKQNLLNCSILVEDTGDVVSLGHSSESPANMGNADLKTCSVGIKRQLFPCDSPTLESVRDSAKERQFSGIHVDRTVRNVRQKLDTRLTERRISKKFGDKRQAFSKLSFGGLCHELEMFYHDILNYRWKNVHDHTVAVSSKENTSTCCHIVLREDADGFENPEYDGDFDWRLLDQDSGHVSRDEQVSYSKRTTTFINQLDKKATEYKEVPTNDLQDHKIEATNCLDQTLICLTEAKATDMQSSDATELCDAQDPGENIDAEMLLKEDGLKAQDCSSGSAQTSEPSEFFLEQVKLVIKDSESSSVMELSLEKMLDGKPTQAAARLFFEILVLKTRNLIDVKQETAYCDILVKIEPEAWSQI